MFSRGQRSAQLIDDFEIRPTVLRGVHDLWPGKQVTMAQTVMTDVIELEARCSWKHDIGQCCGGCHENVGDSNKIEFHQSIKSHAAVRIGQQGIGPLEVSSSYRIRSFIKNRLSEISRGHGHQLGDGPVVGMNHLFRL